MGALGWLLYIIIVVVPAPAIMPTTRVEEITVFLINKIRLSL
jgi:hypothetical protein